MSDAAQAMLIADHTGSQYGDGGWQGQNTLAETQCVPLCRNGSWSQLMESHIMLNAKKDKRLSATPTLRQTWHTRSNKYEAGLFWPSPLLWRPSSSNDASCWFTSLMARSRTHTK